MESEYNLDKDTHFVSFLSNYEVYRYLREIKEETSGHQSKTESNTHMSTLIYETLQYFYSTPCVAQTPEAIETTVVKLKPYNLTKSEKLSIVNMRPVQPIEIQAIIEESEERLTETQVEEIINIVEENLPMPPDQVKQEYVDDDDDSSS